MTPGNRFKDCPDYRPDMSGKEAWEAIKHTYDSDPAIRDAQQAAFLDGVAHAVDYVRTMQGSE